MTREELYNKCENMEELYDNFYYPLLVENQELKSQLKGTTHCFDEEEHEKLQENYDRIYTENCKLREEHNINDISLLDENYRLKEVIDKANEWKARDLLQILEDKSERFGKSGDVLENK